MASTADTLKLLKSGALVIILQKELKSVQKYAKSMEIEVDVISKEGKFITIKKVK